jgi:hypothetical protein
VQNGYPSRAEVKILDIFLLLCFTAIALAVRPAIAEIDDWEEIERQMAQEQKALEVNEGQLQLLDRPPEAASHHHQNRLLITTRSLSDGWVTMYQCHSDLDAVPATQIVYKEGFIRNIEVLSSQNIGSVQVEGHSLQLKDVKEESEICISADKKALSFENDRYYLRLGPFMRRFLDGYYPMHVQVEVCYPPFLQLVDSSPVKAITRSRKKTAYAEIDIWVVGKLDIELVFKDTLSGDQ